MEVLVISPQRFSESGKKHNDTFLKAKAFNEVIKKTAKPFHSESTFPVHMFMKRSNH